MDRLAAVGAQVSTAVGDRLFTEGQHQSDLFAIRSGAVAIFHDVDGERQLVADVLGSGMS